MNERRLNDLLSGEDSPGDGIGSLAVGVGSKISLLVDLKGMKSNERTEL